jgi:simple sugar transport system permease protein
LLWGAPLLAIAATLAMGAAIFAFLGVDPARGLGLFFVEPLKNGRALAELSIKATPLLLVALGLSVCFRSNVWNIGAEGQFIAGAVFATGVAIHAGVHPVRPIFVAVLAAGALGGLLWSAIPAFLRSRYHANEILVSLMLVYVAELSLDYLVYGPWKDPDGYNFPQTILFPAPTRVPRLIDGFRANVGLPIAFFVALLAWLFLFRTARGFELDVFGRSPRAARYAGFSDRRALFTAFLGSGALSGLAGALEVAGPLGQLTPHVPVGYGFAGIIVAFVGRLHPIGVVLSSFLMSSFYIGGELAQSRLGFPKSLTLVFQGVLLFALLACDSLVHFRIRSAPAAAISVKELAPAEPKVS